MLEKPEEKEFHKKWESLYVFTGRRSDLTTMISIAVINPMILYVFIGYVAGKSDQSAGVVSYHRWSIVFTMGTAGKKTEKKDRAVHTGCGRTNGHHQGKNK